MAVFSDSVRSYCCVVVRYNGSSSLKPEMSFKATGTGEFETELQIFP